MRTEQHVFRFLHSGLFKAKRATIALVDTIKEHALERFFHTVDIHLDGYGDALLIGDQTVVRRILELIRASAEHDLVAIETEPED